MQKIEEGSGLKDALAVKYISHFKGEIRNSIFIDSTPTR